MGSIGACCCGPDCPTPPELDIVGLTQNSEWEQLDDCCFYTTYDYDSPADNLRYTGPIYSSREYEYKGRVTYSAVIGTKDGSDCLDPSLQEVGYKERWSYGYDRWRKFADYGIGTTVRVYAHKVEVMESGLPVAYWYYRIEQDYAGTRGWERKQLAFDETIYVSTECTTWLGNSNNELTSAYSSAPSEPAWVESILVEFSCSSTTYFKVKESDLDPVHWLAVNISSEDANLPTSSECTPGTQLACTIVYSISSPNACSTTDLSILDTANATTCNIQIRQGTSSLFLDGQQTGRYLYNFNTTLLLAEECCIDLDSVCSWNVTPALFWWWEHESTIDINDCATVFSPYDLLFHGIFEVRLRLP